MKKLMLLFPIALWACVPAGTGTTPAAVPDISPMPVVTPITAPLDGDRKPTTIQPEQPRDALKLARSSSDRCGAESVASLIGQHESIFFSMVFPDTTRFIGPGTAVTQDNQPRRLNFDINGRGIVTRAWCG